MFLSSVTIFYFGIVTYFRITPRGCGGRVVTGAWLISRRWLVRIQRGKCFRHRAAMENVSRFSYADQPKFRFFHLNSITHDILVHIECRDADVSTWQTILQWYDTYGWYEIRYRRALFRCSSTIVTLALQNQCIHRFHYSYWSYIYGRSPERAGSLAESPSLRRKSAKYIFLRGSMTKTLRSWIRTSHLQLMSQAPVTTRPPQPRRVGRK